MSSDTIRQGAKQTPFLKVVTSHVEKVFATQMNPHRRVKIVGQNADLKTVQVTGYGACDAPDGNETPILIPYFSVISKDEYGFPNEGGPQVNDDALITDTTPGNPLIYGQPNLQQTNPYTSDVVAGPGIGTSSYGTYDYNGVAAPGHKSKIKKKPKIQILLGPGLYFANASNGLSPTDGGNDPHTGTTPADTTGDKFVSVQLASNKGLKFDGNGLAVSVDGTTIDYNGGGALEALGGNGDGSIGAGFVAGNAIDLVEEPHTSGSSFNTVINTFLATVGGSPQSGLCNTGGDDGKGLKIDLASASGGVSGLGAGPGINYSPMPWFVPPQYRTHYRDGWYQNLDDVAKDDNPHRGPAAAWWTSGWNAAKRGAGSPGFVRELGVGGILPGPGSGGSTGGSTAGPGTADAVTCAGGTKGSGLQIDAGNGNQLGVYLADVSGLGFGGVDGEALTVTTDLGLELTSVGIRVKLCDEGGSSSAGDPTNGSGLALDTCGLFVKVDGVSVTINAEGELVATPVPYTAGNGIDVTDMTISARPDNTTIVFDGFGRLKAIDDDSAIGFCLTPTIPPHTGSNDSDCYVLDIDPTTLGYNDSGQLTVLGGAGGTGVITVILGTAPITVSTASGVATVALDSSGAAQGDFLGFNGTSVGWSNPLDLLTVAGGLTITHNSDGTAQIAWSNPGYMNNPMVAQDDLIIGAAGGNPARLAVGSPGDVLTVDASNHIIWHADDDTSGGGTDADEVTNLNGLTGDVTISGAGSVSVSDDGLGIITITGGAGGSTSSPGVTSLILNANPPDVGDIAFLTSSDGHLVISRTPGSGTDPTIYEFDVPVIGYVSGDLDVTGTETVFGNLIMGIIAHPIEPGIDLILTLETGTALGIGAYDYVYCYTTAGGLTTNSPVYSITTTAGHRAVQLEFPIITESGVTGRRLFRTPVNTPGDWRRVADIPGTADTFYHDVTPDSLLGTDRPPIDDTGAIGAINAAVINCSTVNVLDHVELDGHELQVLAGQLCLDGVPIGGSDVDTGGGTDPFIAFDVADPGTPAIWVLYQRADGAQYKLQMHPVTTGGSGPGDFVPGEYVPGGG